MHNICENELIHSAQQGSEDAFAELLRRSRPRLWRAAIGILKNPEEAEDAIQNATWKAWQHLEGFRQDSSFNTWLTSIVVNQARMRLRELRRARVVSIDDAPEDGIAPLRQIADSALDPEQNCSGRELRRALNREIGRLPRQLRQIMLLYVENRSMPEAADTLGLSVAAAKTRLFRARQELHNRMRRYTELPAVAA